MTQQEEIPYTKEEVEAMAKTIAQLRKEKKELLDNVCDLIVSGKVYWILRGDKEALAELIRNEFK